MTATWNNTASGDNNTDTISGVTVDFSQFGGGTAVAATNSGGIWTATYTIVAGSINTTSRNVSVTATDHHGQHQDDDGYEQHATVDDMVPTVTAANIHISGATGTGGAFKIGNTVTATWNNTASGDNNTTDSISSVTVNFSQFGGGTAVAATNSSNCWTTTYTIVAGSINTTSRNVSPSSHGSCGQHQDDDELRTTPRSMTWTPKVTATRTSTSARATGTSSGSRSAIR